MHAQSWAECGPQGCPEQWPGPGHAQFCARPYGHPGEHMTSLVRDVWTHRWGLATMVDLNAYLDDQAIT